MSQPQYENLDPLNPEARQGAQPTRIWPVIAMAVTLVGWLLTMGIAVGIGSWKTAVVGCVVLACIVTTLGMAVVIADARRRNRQS
jgi:hypothetical protein